MMAPERLPTDSRTEATVTVRPMSRSRPVPCFSAPNRGVAYHWLYQGRAAFPATASAAFCGLSPSPRPAGPNAATLAGDGREPAAVVCGEWPTPEANL